MFKKSTTKITRYEYKSEEYGMYYVDIVDGPNSFEAWIQNNHSGMSSLMFGVPYEYDLPFDNKHVVTTRKEFIAMVEDAIEDYIHDWEEELEEINEMQEAKWFAN